MFDLRSLISNLESKTGYVRRVGRSFFICISFSPKTHRWPRFISLLVSFLISFLIPFPSTSQGETPLLKAVENNEADAVADFATAASAGGRARRLGLGLGLALTL